MRILINDFAGHPFQLQLSRTLASRGHDVLHTYCASNLSPKGAVERRPDDPATFAVHKITLDAPFEKYGLLKRWTQERRVGQAVVEAIESFKPDRIICANTPLGAQGAILRHARSRNIPFVFWVQDMLGIGIDIHLRRRLPGLGAVIGTGFRMYEELQLILSSHVVAISGDFLAHFPRLLMRRRNISVIENWAPLAELPLRERDNEWSRRNGLTGKTCLLYAGTLGLKHNPDLLVRLARTFQDREDVRVVVISEGQGAQFLADRKRELGLDRLMLLPFQKFEDMPDVLASADILVSILEKEAGIFAVPSKVLTYLCAARPLLLAMPEENLAARIVRMNGAGLSAPPDDPEAFAAVARHLVNSPSVRSNMALRARQYAERTFDVEQIATRFEALLARSAKPATSTARIEERKLKTSWSA
jgi:glycosyltransferase involved in cell wall biosynthesis